SDKSLTVKQRHRTGIVASAFVNKNIVIGRRIIAAAVFEGRKSKQAAKWIRESATTCGEGRASGGVVVDEPDHSAYIDSNCRRVAALGVCQRIAESIGALEPSGWVVSKTAVCIERHIAAVGACAWSPRNCGA